MRLAWSSREVEDRLHDIMCSIHQTCVDHGKRADDSVSYVMVRTLVASFAWPTRCCAFIILDMLFSWPAWQ